jgi:secreted trypsin-like serine protease
VENREKMKLILVFVIAVIQVTISWKLENLENPGNLIVGGQRANIEDYPHSLALYDRQRGGFMCGAVNIARLWAMSAAHCLHSNTPPTMIELYGGSNSRISGGHLFFVLRYILHPNYARFTLDFDIALVSVHVRRLLN